MKRKHESVELRYQRERYARLEEMYERNLKSLERFHTAFGIYFDDEGCPQPIYLDFGMFEGPDPRSRKSLELLESFPDKDDVIRGLVFNFLEEN